MQMKQYRRDIAELLRAGKQDYARIRVEAVIREAFTLTAYEILELYLELLAVRSSLVANSKEIPRDMIEALSSVLYAASRVPDLPELTSLHKMFAQKYGKEYVSEACSDVSCRRWMVNENLQHCLTVEPPEPAVKLETLSEIAQEYGVEWDMYRAQQDILPKDPKGGTSVPLPCIPASSSQVQQQQHHLQQQGSGQAAPAAPAAASSGVGQAPVGSAAGQGAYADVAAAAAAAVAAAQQARSAAEAAARLAGAAGRPPNTPGSPPPRNRGGGAGGGGGGGGAGMAVPAAGPAAAAGAPDGWLSAVAQQQAAAAGASGPPAAAGATMQMRPLPQQQPQQQQQQQAPTFRMPSAEDIQRAYDSAQGPPAKPTAAAAAAAGSGAAPASAETAEPQPAAPSVQDEETAAAATGSANVQGGSSTGDLAGLPGVPDSGVSAATSNSAASSEYDELQKRFEALKKA
ncbi:regulator of Vps4 activity in the MVB pathway-domain-containing protein [Scenedesmus sp. NREL 46B-D3]|nr:regulator of Vps4 activity in the MVB pathway-domain-containing protein [Scenedesmus sp. NREL 46B-D3]